MRALAAITFAILLLPGCRSSGTLRIEIIARGPVTVTVHQAARQDAGKTVETQAPITATATASGNKVPISALPGN